MRTQWIKNNQRKSATVNMKSIIVLMVICFVAPFNTAEAGQAIRAQYTNILCSPNCNNCVPPRNNPSSVAFFNGHWSKTLHPSDDATCPSDWNRQTDPDPSNNIFLFQSSFGQPFARNVPYPDFVTVALTQAREMLYYIPGGSQSLNDTAAFRYLVKLYGKDSGNVVNQLEARVEGIIMEGQNGLYNQAERNRADQAKDILINALKHAPWSHELKDALLDIMYYKTSAAIIIAKEKEVQAYERRILPPPGDNFLINEEITLFETALTALESSPSAYFEFLNDPLGVDSGDLIGLDDAGSGGDSVPYGYQIFKELVPTRSKFAATYLDNDVEKPVLDDNGDNQPDVLFSGYKDIILIFEALRDQSRLSAELAKLYAMRSLGDDVAKAKALITKMINKSHVEGNILLGIFPDYKPSASDFSGFFEAINGWRDGIIELSSTLEFLNGDANMLGFDKDFLMLAQKFDGTNNGNPYTWYDSYDAIYKWMIGDQFKPLTRAIQLRNDAQTSYDTYRGNWDQLREQYYTLDDNYRTRLEEITGADPGPDPYNPSDSDYLTPGNNVGSEINLQLTSIAIAQNTIQQNQQEINNLYKRIEIEIWRRSQETQINADIGDVYIKYGNKQAKLTLEIGEINALQTAANNMAQAAASVSGGLGTQPISVSGGAASYMANAVLQSGWEEMKAMKEAQKERLAAQERAEVQALNDQLLDLSSKANIRTWFLEMNTLALKSQECALLLSQEVARLERLFREKESLERRMIRGKERLLKTYYADPVHRLRYQHAMLQAQFAFEEAQEWVFFAVRALNYKWNQPFSKTVGNMNYGESTIFSIRNADELEDLVAAMELFNGTQAGQTNWVTYYDFFSIRDDFLGFKQKDSSGKIITYIDPDTGQKMNYIEAFRKYLRDNMFGDYIKIKFSTVRDIPGGSFFRGPRYSGTTLISKGNYLDKIISLQIRLPGSHTTPPYTGILNGSIVYGGTSLLRNKFMGTVPDPSHPDHVVNEMTPFSTRYWYTDYDGRWIFSDAYTVNVAKMEKVATPRQWPNVDEIESLKERSVAATDWTLWIPALDLGTEVLKIDELDDIELFFYHQAANRP